MVVRVCPLVFGLCAYTGTSAIPPGSFHASWTTWHFDREWFEPSVYLRRTRSVQPEFPQRCAGSNIPVQPLGVRPGSKNDCFATSDNSPNNPANQHPIREVRLGDQSWEEMMTGLFEIAFDTQRSATEVIRFPQLKLVAAQQRPRHNRGLKRL
jgi:hypothetical protein